MKLLSVKVNRTDTWEFKTELYKPFLYEDFSYGAAGSNC